MHAEERCAVLIVGAGPAGIAAACVAAESGANVLAIDDNPQAGGQIWRGGGAGARRWSERLAASTAKVWCGTRALAPAGPGRLLGERDGRPIIIKYDKLILCTGARELLLPFPGWTLPGVMGAGGLQALVEGGLPIAGRRLVVAGSGPLLIAVAANMLSRGAHLQVIAEQTSFGRTARFAAGLASLPSKIAQAVALRWSLRRVRFLYRAWPVAAEGNGHVEAVRLNTGDRIECDYLACGFGLVPNVELPLLCGCRIENGFVAVDERQQTSVPDVLCAGEPTGIGGVERSLIEGQIAGHTAAGQTPPATLVRSRGIWRRFSRQLKRAFELRDHLKTLCAPDTIVCRCEDVRFAAMSAHDGWRSAKLHTRCGMGPCQGRVCGAAADFLFGWDHNDGHARPPAFAASMETIAAVPNE